MILLLFHTVFAEIYLHNSNLLWCLWLFTSQLPLEIAAFSHLFAGDIFQGPQWMSNSTASVQPSFSLAHPRILGAQCSQFSFFFFTFFSSMDDSTSSGISLVNITLMWQWVTETREETMDPASVKGSLLYFPLLTLHPIDFLYSKFAGGILSNADLLSFSLFGVFIVHKTRLTVIDGLTYSSSALL